MLSLEGECLRQLLPTRRQVLDRVAARLGDPPRGREYRGAPTDSVHVPLGFCDGSLISMVLALPGKPCRFLNAGSRNLDEDS
jgi:hypothetical protein